MSEPSGGSALARRARAGALVVLLTGALFPTLGGLPLHYIATAIAVPMIVWEFLRPGRNPALWFVLAVFAPLLLSHWLLLPEPGNAYGQEKVSALFTSTVMSAAGVPLMRDRRTVLTFAKAWVVIGLALTVATFLSGSATGRATTFDSNPIWIARAIGGAVIATVWLGWNRHLRLIVWAPLAAALVVGVLQTGSRGPAGGMVVGVLMIAAFAVAHRRRSLLVLAAASAAALLVAPLIPAVRESRAFSFLSELTGPGEANIGLRSEMWGRSVDLFTREPWGVGFGNWGQHAPAPSHHDYPHNLFLEVFTETGWLPGLVVAGAVVVVLVRLVRRSRADSIVSLVLGMLVAETVSVSVSGDVNARTFFAMLTLGWVVSTWYPTPAPEEQAGELRTAPVGRGASTRSSRTSARSQARRA